MNLQILLSPPDVGELEAAYVQSALRSGWIAPAGPDLDLFETQVAARVGVTHAVALSSGTAALHLALVSWGVGPGDVVPVSTLTFAATVNAVRYVGAEPHFVDCDPVSGNMSPLLLRRALEELTQAGRRVPAIIPVDLLGKCVAYEPVCALAQEFGARLLSDAAESFGATYNGAAAGSIGDASVLSFNGNKIMTTSGGGMLLTGDAVLAAHVRKLSTQAREQVVHYEHREVGYNYRLSNVLAALGRAQLLRLDDMLARRRAWRERYRALVQRVPWARVFGGEDDEFDNCWLTAITIDPDQAPRGANEVGEALRVGGIESRPIWKPMHLQPVSRGFSGTLDGSAERLFATTLALPSGSSMTDQAFDRVESAVLDLLS